MRIFGLTSLIIAVGVIAFLVSLQVKNLELVSGTKNENPTSVASSIKFQSDLKALSIRLNLYYSENGAYPRSLDEIDLAGIEGNSYNYIFCAETNVIASSGGENLVLLDGKETFEEESSCQ